MSKNDDGGPAFARSIGSSPFSPDAATHWWNESQSGMTLRDWFAGQALAGICGNASTNTSASNASVHASDAYAVADAMLEERKK